MEKCGYRQLNVQGKIGGRRGRSKVFLKYSPESLAADFQRHWHCSRNLHFPQPTTNLTDGEKQFLRENHNSWTWLCRQQILNPLNHRNYPPLHLCKWTMTLMTSPYYKKNPDNELRDFDFAPAPSSQESTKGDTPIVKRLRIRKGYSNYKY